MKKLILLALCFATAYSNAQVNLTYQKPSKEILELVDVQPTPSVMLDDNKEFMVLMYRDAFKTIAELSRTELRLGGLRIDPKTNIGSRTGYRNNIKIKNLKASAEEIIQVKGLPQNPLIANFSWSPDQKKAVFTNTTTNGVELWVLDIASASAKKLTKPQIADEFRAADFLIFPSIHESFGLIPAEAMSAGLPVIATNRTAPPEFINDQSGILVDPESETEILEAMVKMISTLDDYDGSVIRGEMIERFGFDVFGEWLVDVYEGLTA